MKWLQAIQTKQPQHKYAINAAMLGDHNELAWSNLGYWNHAHDSYPQACRQLAIHLATAINLNSKDNANPEIILTLSNNFLLDIITFLLIKNTLNR